MFGINWLTEQWKSLQDEIALQKQHDLHAHFIDKAIEKRDAEQIKSIVAQTEDEDAFIKAHYDSWLKNAIKMDDVDVFETVWALRADMPPSLNYCFVKRWEILGITEGFSKTPILCEALNRRSENVALHVAIAPETNIYEQERHVEFVGPECELSGELEYKDRPTILAKKQGLSNVHKVLLNRDCLTPV